MSANVDALIREGIAAYRAGRREEARTLLLRAVEADQYSEQAWLWLSAVVESREDQRTCLENVLAINPSNERARAGLKSLAPAAPPPPPVPPSTAALNLEDFPTSVEWADEQPAVPLFSEPAPATPEISDDEYDDWVANLNLPASTPTADNNAVGGTDPFDNAFFGTDDFTDAPSLESGSTGTSPFSTLDFETVFGSPEAVASMPPPPPPAPPDDASPSGFMAPNRTSQRDDETDLFSTGVFASFEAGDEPDTDLEALDTEELFRYIPPEIQPTRLPGTRERYAPALLLALVVLVLLNAGALALLVYRLL